MKLDILAIGVHPDDIELGCSGTLAKEASAGRKIGALDLTRGELGTRGTADIRDQEAAKAAQILNLSVRHNLGFKDGFFTDDEAHQIEIIKYIRAYQPEIVLCNAIYDRHPDHGRASKLVSTACFLSGLPKIKTSYDGKPQESWRPKQVYHYIQWQDIEPDFIVDITGFIDVKIASVKAYSSQFFDPNSTEPSTPISNKNFLDSISYRAANMGRYIGVEYGEGFTAERYPAVNSIFDLK